MILAGGGHSDVVGKISTLVVDIVLDLVDVEVVKNVLVVVLDVKDVVVLVVVVLVDADVVLVVVEP